MGKKLKHLLLATLEDPHNPRSWSGIPYSMRIALEGRLEKLSILANLKPKRNPKDVILRVALGGKPPRYPLYLTAAAQKDFANRTAAAIHDLHPDAMLTISSHCIIRLQPPEIPVFMFTDAPWISWKETYKNFERMPLLGRRFATQEAEAARRCTGLIFASEWAAGEAQRLYQVPPDKIHAQPMGANWTPGIAGEELSAIIDRRPADRLDLLFLGRDWERKGGPLAIQIALALTASGVPNVCLHIVGCNPEIPSDAQNIVKIHGLLRQGIPAESAQLRKLFLESHFLIVPTQAECFGLVFAEGHAFGLPGISCAVQAVPSIILDGVTGILEPKEAPAEAYAPRILSLVENRDEYRRMAHAARARFEAELSWDRFAQGIVQIIEESL
jgi:glycosyltransferase involved in cell wall biosynthesis